MVERTRELDIYAVDKGLVLETSDIERTPYSSYEDILDDRGLRKTKMVRRMRTEAYLTFAAAFTSATSILFEIQNVLGDQDIELRNLAIAGLTGALSLRLKRNFNRSSSQAEEIAEDIERIEKLSQTRLSS